MNGSSVAHIGNVASHGEGKWTRCFRAADGTIYWPGRLKSTDGGRTFVPQAGPDLEAVHARPEGAVLARPGLFLALDDRVRFCEPGLYAVKTWRSSDELRSVQQEEAQILVPEGPTRERREREWYGIFVYRTIIEMPGGELLATMYGNFRSDSIVPTDYQSKRETAFKQRSFVATSKDEGRTWRYLATVARPSPEDPVGEGFVEPAIVRLEDSRLLCVMRTGHYFPLYSSWSSDGGKTWTPPLYTGLERGCDPCLIRLHDGRLALSYGKRYPERWSQITPGGDIARWQYPGQGQVRLAVSADGNGETWDDHIIGTNMGSCYSTIFEVEPGVIFCQADRWCWRVTLEPRQRGAGAESRGGS